MAQAFSIQKEEVKNDPVCMPSFGSIFWRAIPPSKRIGGKNLSPGFKSYQLFRKSKRSLASLLN
ncbi:hypothetical protein DDT91_12020 [Algoriphagus sp. AK58]|nr:hypothetical protein [Algoriphagus sp. AK58]